MGADPNDVRYEARPRRPRILVAWRGASQFDSRPVRVAIHCLQGGSLNRKTGPMAQVIICPDDVPPHVSIGEGSDGSVCGDCPLRPAAGGGCYVNVGAYIPRVWECSTILQADLDAASPGCPCGSDRGVIRRRSRSRSYGGSWKRRAARSGSRATRHTPRRGGRTRRSEASPWPASSRWNPSGRRRAPDGARSASGSQVALSCRARSCVRRARRPEAGRPAPGAWRVAGPTGAARIWSSRRTGHRGASRRCVGCFAPRPRVQALRASTTPRGRARRAWRRRASDPAAVREAPHEP